MKTIRLLKPLSFNFSFLSSSRLQLDDVSLLRRDTETTSMRVFQKKYLFENDDPLMILKNQIHLEEPHIKNIEIMDTNNIEYHDFSPIGNIAEEDFLIRLNKVYTVCFINETLNLDDLFLNDKSLKDSRIDSLARATNKHAASVRVLAETATAVLKGLEQSVSESPGELMREKILSDAVYFENKRNFYGTVLQTLQHNIAKKAEIDKILDTNNSSKSKRLVKFIGIVVFCQLAFTQYGTYVVYSWDIMEPIVCLFGTIDVFLAYLYWYVIGTEFDYKTVYDSSREKVNRADKRVGEIRAYEFERLNQVVKKKLAIFSDNVLDIIEAYEEEVDGVAFESEEED